MNNPPLNITDEQIKQLVYFFYHEFDLAHEGPSMDDIIGIVHSAIYLELGIIAENERNKT